MQHRSRQATGPQVVCLHGFTGDTQAWDDVAAHMPQQLGLRALPLPGHKAGVPPQPTFESTCDALAATLRTPKATPVHLVGYSLGARLALGIMLRHPECVAELTLISGQIGLEQAEDRVQRRQADKRWIELLEGQGIEAFVQAWETQPVFASQRGLSAAQQRQQHERRLLHAPQALADSLRSTGLAEMPNYWPALPTSQRAIHFVVGSQDPKYIRIAQRASALAPRASMHVVQDCGHNPLLECPSALAAILSRLVRPDSASQTQAR